MDVKYYANTNVLTIPTSAVIGSDLWFNRTGGKENHIEIIDIIELREGLIERCYATQYREDNGKYNTGYVTEANTWSITDVYSLSNSANDTIHYFNPYIPAEDEIVTYANIVDSASYTTYVLPQSVKSGEYKTYFWESQVWSKAPPMYPGYTQELDYTTKYIIGKYLTLTVSGFTGDYTTFNGEYYYYDYLDYLGNGVFYHVYFQTDGGGELYFNETETQYFTYDGYWYFIKDFPPFIRGVAIEQSYLDECIVTATRGALATIDPSNASSKTIIYDAPFIQRTPINGWFIPNRLDTWEKELGTIDEWLIGTINYRLFPNPTYYYRFGAMLFPAIIYPTGIDISDDYEKMGFFIEPTLWDCDTFDRRFDLKIDIDTLFTQIESLGSIQKITMPSPFTGYFYGFGDNVVNYSNFSGTLYPSSVKQGKYNLTKTMLFQRYEAIKAMQYNLLGATGVDGISSIHWINEDLGTTNNTFFADGYGSSMADAKANALADIIWYSSNVRPYLYTACYHTTSSNYYYKMAGVKAVLKNDFMTNLFDSEIKYYANSTNCITNITTLAETPIVDYDVWGETLVENKYKQFDSEAVAKRSNSQSNVIVGDYDITSALFNPQDPPNDNQWSIKGFKVNGEEAMCKWTFNHCT